MKYTKTILFTIFITGFCYAQKIQIKKGILLKDDVPVGKLEGKATLLNGTYVSISSNEDVPLMIIKDPLIVYGSPFHAPLRYYSINFVPLRKKVAIIPSDKKFFTSEKKLMEYLYESIGNDFLTKDGLNEKEIDRFMASSKDQTKFIQEDSTRIMDLIKISKEKLQSPLVPRPVGAGYRLDSYDKQTIDKNWAETYQELDIIQGDVVIGKITKRYKGDPSVAVGSVPSSRWVHYIVTRKVVPFTHEGKSISFVNMASVKGDTQYPDIYVDCDKAWSKDVKFADIFAAEHELISWLITKGCL